MQVLARLAIVVLVLLASMNSAAKPSEADFEEAQQQLRQCSRDLREVGKAMRAHAKTSIPEGLNEEEKRTLAAKRSELKEAAAAAFKLADQCADRGRKARRRTLTRADMKGLDVETDRLAGRVNETTARSPAVEQRSPAGLYQSIGEVEAAREIARMNRQREPKSATGLNEAIKEVESVQETARNKRQQAVTAFQNFDQKWNQLFNMLTTVLKNKKDMEAGVTRNML